MCRARLTVGLADAHSWETLTELLDQLGGERCRAALESAEGAEVVFRNIGVLRDDLVNLERDLRRESMHLA